MSSVVWKNPLPTAVNVSARFTTTPSPGASDRLNQPLDRPGRTHGMTSLRTLDDIARLADVTILAHLDAQVDVPILAGLQAQGDVIVIPTSGQVPAATTLIPADGVPVVRGENGGNTHLLIGDGPAFFDAAPADRQTLGTLTVPTGSTAYHIHPEHGAMGHAPGTYVVRRQREQADEIQLVAD